MTLRTQPASAKVPNRCASTLVASHNNRYALHPTRMPTSRNAVAQMSLPERTAHFGGTGKVLTTVLSSTVGVKFACDVKMMSKTSAGPFALKILEKNQRDA